MVSRDVLCVLSDSHPERKIMARRAIWKGVLNFRKHRVPVKLYAAAESKQITFHLLHDQDQVRLRRQMVCPVEDKPVPDEEIAKGAEVGENRYVLLDPEDLEELKPETDRDIDVEGFFDPDEADPRYFDRPYHLGPDGEEQKFAALVKALVKEDKLGLCHWSFRNHHYHGILRARDGALELVTVRLAEEIVDPGAFDLPRPSVSKKEHKTARYLIDELSSDFEPDRYANDFEKDLRELIETKARGGKVKKRKATEEKPTESKELLDVLEASLEQVRGDRKGR